MQQFDDSLYFVSATNELVEVDLEEFSQKADAGAVYSPAIHPIKQPIRAIAVSSHKRIVAVTSLFSLLTIDTSEKPPVVSEKSMGGPSESVPRITCIACTAPHSKTNDSSQTVVAAFSEIYTESVFYLFDGLLELQMVADIQRQFFEVLDMKVVSRGAYSLLLAVSACDNMHLLLVCEDVLAVLQSDFHLFNGVIRGVAVVNEAEAVVFGKTRDEKGFLKRVRLPL